MSFAALAPRARAANDTTRAQINNIPSKSHVIPLLTNLKYLPPQSLACEVYRKQENKVKCLLPQARHTRKIIDKMQKRVVKGIF